MCTAVLIDKYGQAMHETLTKFSGNYDLATVFLKRKHSANMIMIVIVKTGEIYTLVNFLLS